MRIARARLSDGTTMVGAVIESGFAILNEDSPLAVVEAAREAPMPTEADALPLEEVQLLPCIAQPPSVRDFMAFEAHAVNARAGTGQPVPDIWYEQPCFYFSNPAAILGPGDPLEVPRGSTRLDYEVEVAVVVGAEARDLDPNDPATLDVIAGMVLMNDWSARDLQMREMPMQIGFAKGKDFATSLGPWLLTPDELLDFATGRPAIELQATVNGRLWSTYNFNEIHYPWGEILAAASANTVLRPGDVIGAGTGGTGCILELRALGGRDEHPWLQPGDEVVISGGPLGSLANTIVATGSAS